MPTKRPAFHAVAVLARELASRPHVSRRGERVYQLTGKGNPVHIVWREDSDRRPAAPITGWWRVRTLDGKTVTRQGSSIKLTPMPLFMESTKSPFIY